MVASASLAGPWSEMICYILKNKEISIYAPAEMTFFIDKWKIMAI